MSLLKFLGRGCAFFPQEGNTSAYIKDNNTLLLIDCGENIFQRIMEKSLLDDITDVYILITHLHSDHIGSLSSLLYYGYYIKNIKPKVLYPNTDIIKYLTLNGNKYEENSIDNEYEFCKIQNNNIDGYTNVTNNLKIQVIETEHKDTMKCYGYFIFDKITQKNIYYSGDSNMIPRYEIMINHLKNNIIDEFYQDTSLAEYGGNVHLSFRELCDLIPQELRNKVYCMHIDNNTELPKLIKSCGFNVVKLK